MESLVKKRQYKNCYPITGDFEHHESNVICEFIVMKL